MSNFKQVEPQIEFKAKDGVTCLLVKRNKTEYFVTSQTTCMTIWNLGSEAVLAEYIVRHVEIQDGTTITNNMMLQEYKLPQDDFIGIIKQLLEFIKHVVCVYDITNTN